MRPIALVTAMLITLFGTPSHAGRSLAEVKSWLCFYGAEFPQGPTPEYDLYVLDSYNHPDLSKLKAKGKQVVGYVSFGEIRKDSIHFQKAVEAKALVDINENWPDAYRTNLASKKWHDIVVKTLVPETIAKGFDGIFIDTIDTAIYQKDVKKTKGAVEGAVALLKKVRRKFPNIVMILNNGLFLTDEVGNDIDALVVEDIYTLYDFKKKRYRMTDEKWTAERIAPLKIFQEKFGKPILSLDYLDAKDKKDIATVSSRARGEGFVPYISDIHLNTIFFHP